MYRATAEGKLDIAVKEMGPDEVWNLTFELTSEWTDRMGPCRVRAWLTCVFERPGPFLSWLLAMVQGDRDKLRQVFEAVSDRRGFVIRQGHGMFWPEVPWHWEPDGTQRRTIWLAGKPSSAADPQRDQRKRLWA